MRIVIVSHYFAPHTGGVETVVAAHARGLKEAGHDVVIVTSKLDGDRREEAQDGVRVVRVACSNILEERLGVPVPIVALGMQRAIELERPDIVIAHGHAYIGSAHAARAARRLDVPFVVVQHNPFVEYPAPLELVEHTVDRTMGRWVLGAADLVVCVSAHVAKYVHEIAPKAPTAVVYNGVDTTRFFPKAPNARGGRVRVATLRRLVERQGIDTLIKAWRDGALGEMADLTIGGAGRERERLEKLAAGDESIRFVGRVPDEELVEFYHDCDVFVLPTNSGEGFGLVAAEALVCGRMVIATDEGGAKEVVRPGVNGMHVPASDPGALAAALRLACDDYEMRTRMSEAAALCGFSWEKSCEDLLCALQSVSAASVL